MLDRLQELKDEAIQKVNDAITVKDLKDLRVAYLGKKGPITEVLKGMGKLSAEERPKVGQMANEVREAVSAAISEKEEKLEEEALVAKLREESIDVTLPGRVIPKGSKHPLTSVVETIEDIFMGMASP